jgi:hypothetical protein
MDKPKFKKGEWCFCEFTLKQVTETNGNRITTVSDGYFSHGSYDMSDRCYPMEMKVKVISDDVNYWHNQFHQLKHNSLNHPDLNRALIEMWVDMCENRNDEEKLKKLYEKLNTFGQDVVNRVQNIKDEIVGNVKLFR